MSLTPEKDVYGSGMCSKCGVRRVEVWHPTPDGSGERSPYCGECEPHDDDWAASVTAPENNTHAKPDWLRLVWECNKIHTGMFDRPEVEKVEHYPDADISFTRDHVVTVKATTPFGSFVIRQAARNLGLILNEEDK